mgnify:CR=1 FL=1
MSTMNPVTITIIPARGGSKGVVGKNIKLFLGVPLLTHSIRHSLESSRVRATYVTTDDAQIAAVAREAGATVIPRPPELSGDRASSESALLHALHSISELRADVVERVIFLQATSPLRRTGEVNLALDTFDLSRAESLVSVCPSHDFLWQPCATNGARAINYQPASRPRRQDMEPAFRENGSIYIFDRIGFLAERCRLFGRVALHQMPPIYGHQIDTADDWMTLEAIGDGLRRNSLKTPTTDQPTATRLAA